MSRNKLSDIIEIISGGTPKTSIPEYWNGDIGWLSVVDFNNDTRYVYDTEKKITKLGLENSNTKLLNKGDIIISARGTVGALAQIGTPLCFNQSCFGLRGKKGIIENDFLYYYLKNYVTNIIKRSQGSVFDTINLQSFDLMEVEYPKDTKIQRKIAEKLSLLDYKIELNNKINSELEIMAKTLYDYWFVQFDFPNEEGNPYKSSGGAMKWNEELKREIPVGWEVKKLKNILPVITGKEDANFAEENGKYHFFTCSDKISYCNQYAFEGKALLLAGNGNFDLKFYLGKFNAYQRTYVLIPNDDTYFALAYFSVSNQLKRLTNGSVGSIIKFITKGDIENIDIILNNEYLKLYKDLNNILFSIDMRRKENQELASLRDWLLPMLMNGQVSVK